MVDDLLFADLCKPEVLKLGWHLAHLDSRDDFVSDSIAYEDFASQLTERLIHLVEEVRNRRYRPRYLLEVDIPKSGLSVRPGNVLPIEESTILHAIIYLLAPTLDRRLSENVFSHRLHQNWKIRIKKGRYLFRDDRIELPFLKGKTIRALNPLEPWYLAWPEFDNARVKAAREKGYVCLTRTDIAAYFENIDLSLLETQLRSLVPRQNRIMELLMRILQSWTRITSTGISVGRGIPQGNDVSSFLGNIYLLPLDKALIPFCKKRDAVWYRYVDDVEVYSKDYATARDVVFVINETLRSLHLNLQGSKTEILTGSKLDAILSKSELDKIDVAMNGFRGMHLRARKNQEICNYNLKQLASYCYSVPSWIARFYP